MNTTTVKPEVNQKTATASTSPSNNAPQPQSQPYNSNQEYVSPEVNIYETKEGYVLQAEMPGVNKEGLDIGLEGNTLTINGRRAVTRPNVEALYRESSRLDYRRVFELDPAIDATRIDAKIEQGVLTLTLPKSERVKPRKITVSE